MNLDSEQISIIPSLDKVSKRKIFSFDGVTYVLMNTIVTSRYEELRMVVLRPDWFRAKLERGKNLTVFCGFERHERVSSEWHEGDIHTWQYVHFMERGEFLCQLGWLI